MTSLPKPTAAFLVALALLLAMTATLGVPAQARAEGPGAFDPEAATEAYLARLTSAERERSDAYHEGKYWIWLWDLVFGLAVAWLLLASGLASRARLWVESWTSWQPLRDGLYGFLYLLTLGIVALPFTLYVGFFREHRYGLATQELPDWLRQISLGIVVWAVFGAVFLVALYAVLRRSPRRWWLWGSGVCVLFLALSMTLAPVFILPLFNTYEPLEDEAIQEPILAMARAHGVPVDKVYVSDASRQTTRISANVTGFLGTQRITLNDNLLERCSLPEIEAVMGHEIGHYVLNHVTEMLVYLALLTVGAFVFLRWTFDGACRRWGKSWGVRGVADLAGLPLLAALASVYLFAATPVLHNIVRANEIEADHFGLSVARQPDGFAEVALKLAEYRKLSPHPVEEWLFYSHPSGRNRILTAMRWKAAQLRTATPEDPASPTSPLLNPPPQTNLE